MFEIIYFRITYLNYFYIVVKLSIIALIFQSVFSLIAW